MEEKVILRRLKPEDAPLMLEWMHDPSVVENMQTDFSRKTLDDCLAFIAAAQEFRDNIHMAIALEDDDTYLGTVSLKHIRDNTAEFAITVRTRAMGKGYASQGMRKILEYGLREMGLNSIYWCVSPDNGRAVRFYTKNGFGRIPVPEITAYTAEERARYMWFGYDASDLNRKNEDEVK